MLAAFSPPARLAVIRAGMTAADCGQRRLSDGFLLLALAEGEPLACPVELGVTASSVRAAIEARAPRRRSPVRPLRVTLNGPAGAIVLNESGRKAIEVARWASRRGHRTLVEREDLLCGLLADGRSESVRILRRDGADLGRLGADLRRWHRSA